MIDDRSPTTPAGTLEPSTGLNFTFPVLGIGDWQPLCDDEEPMV